MTTEILIIGSARPTSSIFKPKSSKGVALGTMVETVQDIRFSHCIGAFTGKLYIDFGPDVGKKIKGVGKDLTLG